MKKIMFNDAYGLTQATIDGYKTNTRRLEFNEVQERCLNNAVLLGYPITVEDNHVVFYDKEGELLFAKPTRYKVGEVIAVAQSYASIGAIHPDKDSFIASIAKIYGVEHDEVSGLPGWRNKMFVKAELMPHNIRITGIGVERLQDISAKDCIREGVRALLPDFATQPTHYEGAGLLWPTRRAAFAHLINKVSGCDTWASNPWVVAYEYELTDEYRMLGW